jgi:quercetin dioxygenase-like cupin family protein
MSSQTLTATRVDSAEQPVRASPSGLLTQYLAWRETGGTELFVAQQWLGTGQRVFLHTHAIEEVLVFMAGIGTATLGEDEVPVGPGITLVVPAGVVHGFRNEADDTLHVLVIFPGDTFAQTDFVEPTPDQRHLQPADVLERLPTS